MSEAREDALAANTKLAASFRGNGKLARPPADVSAALTGVGTRIDPGEVTGLSEGSASENAVVQRDSPSTGVESHELKSGVRLRFGGDAERARRHGREAALTDGWAADLDGPAFLRTLEMVALIIPLERG
jgi:hypothetical protein